MTSWQDPSASPGQPGQGDRPRGPQTDDPQSPAGGYGLTVSAWHDPAGAASQDPGTWPDPPSADQDDTDHAQPASPYEDPSHPGGYRGGPRRPGTRRRRRLAAVLVVVIILAAGAAVALTRTGSPAAHPAATARPVPSAARASSQPPARPAAAPLPVSAARRVLAGWLAANNAANRMRSSSALAKIEGGTSFQIDAGSYRWTRVIDPGNSRFQPITLANTSFYIPATARYPMWFAVTGQWTGLDGSRSGLAAAVLVFTRTSAAVPWLEVLEPDLLPASARVHVARTPSGQAELLTPAAAADLAVPPSAVQQLTARYLDGVAGGLAGLSRPGNLQDLRDAQYWRSGNLPAGSAVSLTHTAAGNPVFAFRAAGGGAVLFFDLTATMRLSAPPGNLIRVAIPGYYSSSHPVTSATLSYVDQFALYDPPGGTGADPVVIASIGGIASPN
jgi:hypothetical protein